MTLRETHTTSAASGISSSTSTSRRSPGGSWYSDRLSKPRRSADFSGRVALLAEALDEEGVLEAGDAPGGHGGPVADAEDDERRGHLAEEVVVGAHRHPVVEDERLDPVVRLLLGPLG